MIDQPATALRTLAMTLLLCASVLAQAASSPVISYRSDAEEAHVQALAEELRCLECQNQSVAESHSTLASVIKQQIVNLLRQGESDAQIRAYFIQRYGSLISYRPPFNSLTWVLWCGPFIVVFAGFIGLFWPTSQAAKPAVQSKLGRGRCSS